MSLIWYIIWIILYFQHIASNIVDHDIRPKEILQSSFDLLGEMIKFNLDAFRAFDKVLNTKPKFEKFVATVNKNLVDSNMFIRSLILSLEHFSNVQPEFKGKSYFLFYILYQIKCISGNL